MNIHIAYLINREIQNEFQKQRDWERLVKQAKQENTAAALRHPQEKRVFWQRARKRVTSTR